MARRHFTVHILKWSVSLRRVHYFSFQSVWNAYFCLPMFIQEVTYVFIYVGLNMLWILRNRTFNWNGAFWGRCIWFISIYNHHFAKLRLVPVSTVWEPSFLESSCLRDQVPSQNCTIFSSNGNIFVCHGGDFFKSRKLAMRIKPQKLFHMANVRGWMVDSMHP